MDFDSKRQDYVLGTTPLQSERYVDKRNLIRDGIPFWRSRAGSAAEEAARGASGAASAAPLTS